MSTNGPLDQIFISLITQAGQAPTCVPVLPPSPQVSLLSPLSSLLVWLSSNWSLSSGSSSQLICVVTWSSGASQLRIMLSLLSNDALGQQDKWGNFISATGISNLTRLWISLPGWWWWARQGAITNLSLTDQKQSTKTNWDLARTAQMAATVPLIKNNFRL